ncbi:MAG: hypothetical protein LBV69_09525 [Bacteroidales bacterium]|jgi:arginyl-tRNA--protein-N-Asp/Glu arginylyltransferase|nr:hypothetical protein [Bacteroidales bacterium]
MKRICPVCNSEFDGRVDKKFCCDQCRNTYNNQLNQEDLNFNREINKILKNNRKILKDLFAKNSNHKISKEKFLSLGYNFDYLTNFFKTKTGNIYYFCYDFGYIFLDENSISIVENKIAR